jgi:hypothetical protein
MKTRTRAISVLAAAIVCFAAVPACAQSALIKRLDVNGDGKVSRDELAEGSSQRGMFDRLVAQYKLDPTKTYTLKELEDASGLSGSGSSTSASGPSRSSDSRSGSSGSSGGPPRFGDSRRSSGGPGGSGGYSRGGGGSSASRSSRPSGDSRPYRALEELPDRYRSYDKDGDGQVGLYEWPKDKIAEFLGLDRNDDGFLTNSELKKPSTPNGDSSR